MRLIALIAAVSIALAALPATAQTASEFAGAASGPSRDAACKAAREDATAKAGGKKLSFPEGSCTCAHRGQGTPYDCQAKGLSK